jgi:hypothetical protein
MVKHVSFDVLAESSRRDMKAEAINERQDVAAVMKYNKKPFSTY